jgi:hypothetical protein
MIEFIAGFLFGFAVLAAYQIVLRTMAGASLKDALRHVFTSSAAKKEENGAQSQKGGGPGTRP